MRYNFFTILSLCVRAWSSSRYYKKHRKLGLEFAQFGRYVGKNLLIKRLRFGFPYLIVPVSITRYFEFAFALDNLPEGPGDCLDVSSPRLFSLYCAYKELIKSIKMVNPDSKDISETEKIVAVLNLQKIELEKTYVESLAQSEKKYDCIWSISVIEHIEGDFGDRDAVQLMYNALTPGGRLILTVPVDREHWDEYRSVDHYGLQDQKSEGSYFFQRFYNRESIRERLLDPIGQNPIIEQWFGEIVPGRFTYYIQSWLSNGWNVTVDDPREIVDNYKAFSNWEDMPGVGVCGLVIEKPLID